MAPTGDHPGVQEANIPVRLGDGPALLIADQFHVTSTSLNDWITTIVEKQQLQIQRLALRAPVHFGTDAAAVELARGGCQVTALLVPTRYFHTANSVVDTRDLGTTVKVLVECLSRLDQLPKIN